MTDRTSLARTFVDRTKWCGATMSLLAGDASNRKYYRLTHQGRAGSVVLMDAPSSKGEDVQPFVRIARHLIEAGLSAPHILDMDAANGFLLLEDLGDDLFARVIPDDPTLEPALYATATDVLVALHQHPPHAGLATYDSEVMADLAALALDWYAPSDRATRQEFQTLMGAVLEVNAAETDVLIQRDYHAENLLWLPGRSGIARVGLLDFQDARLGHRAYDLVSLLQDARRDVPAAIEDQMIIRYIAATGTDPGPFRAAYHCLGAQRNLRILGVFARLCLRDGKPGYVDLIPRVWAHLQNDLTDPALAGVRDFLASRVPGPTPEFLSALKDKCAIAPAL